MFRLPHVYTLSVFDSALRSVVCPWEEACRSSKQSCSQHLKIPEERDQPASAGELWTQRRRGETRATHFTNGKQISVCRSLSVHKRRGRRGNVALFYSLKRSYWRLQLVAGSDHCNSVYAQGCDGSTLPTANKIPVCRSLSVYKRRGRRGKVALLCS